MTELKDRVAIVTGAGQGIGREIALSLAENGAKVCVTDITDKRFEVVKEIEANGYRGLAIKCDVSKREDVENMVQVAIEKFGRIDILVNNAGLAEKPFVSLLVEMPEQDWDKILNVNLKGVFYCSRAVLPKMIEQRYGKIISLASIAGYVVGSSEQVHYAASKAAIVGFTKSLALEVAQYGINVDAVAPGPIESPRHTPKVFGEERYEQVRKDIPVGRWGRPKDIANLVVFLASDKSSFITGQCIVIDGGFTLQ